MLLPSLKKMQERMSIKDKESAIYISDDVISMERKLSKSITGGKNTKLEQYENGANPTICSFFWVAQTILDNNRLEKILNKCISGEILCSECKKQNIDLIVNKINSLKF
jgi:tryptophanyl-tRNA synthetase